MKSSCCSRQRISPRRRLSPNPQRCERRGRKWASSTSRISTFSTVRDHLMTKYLVSFPAPAMDVPAEEMAAVSEAAHRVIREAKVAGAYVFGGGINEEVA